MSEKERDFERRREIILAMNVMDDDFFVKIAEDVGAMEEILTTFLQESVNLSWSNAQVHLRNCGSRSVTLDALCKAENGVLYGVEMEKSNTDDHQRRVRYNSSNIDTACTEKGLEFKDIPELRMVYISKTDFLKSGNAIYHVNRVIEENIRSFRNYQRE